MSSFFPASNASSVTKMDVVENDSIRKPKTYVETNRKFKRLTLNNNNGRIVGLEILLISDRSLLGTNTGGDDDDFADGKKNEETESESDEEEEEESGSDVSSDDSEDEQEGAKEGLKTAACAVEVSVGYLSDPENFHGLSHFLEHMVFMLSLIHISEPTRPY